MALMKQATRQLADAGIPLEVRKGIYGYYAIDPTLRKQRGTLVYKTTDALVRAVMEGERPQALE